MEARGLSAADAWVEAGATIGRTHREVVVLAVAVRAAADALERTGAGGALRALREGRDGEVPREDGPVLAARCELCARDGMERARCEDEPRDVGNGEPLGGAGAWRAVRPEAPLT